MTVEIRVQGETVMAAGAPTDVMAARLEWVHAKLGHERHNTPSTGRLKEAAWDVFSDLASEAGRCQQCLADLNSIDGWTNAYCPDHSKPDVLRNHEEWKASR